MPFHHYHFVTHWQVRAPIQKVYEILKDGPRYAQWWRPAYVSSEEIAPGKVRAVVHSRLRYTLTFVTEVTREAPPHEIELRSSGDLVGKGLWKLHQNGEWTKIQFSWEVRAEKPLLRWLSPLLRPLFKWNHDGVMSAGERGLQRLF